MRIRVGIVLFLALTFSSLAAPLPTELYLNGHSLIPSPQEVDLREEVVILDESWGLDIGSLNSDHIAIQSLSRDLSKLYSFSLTGRSDSTRLIKLSIQPGTIQAPDEVAAQAYSLEIGRSGIEVVGNGEAGLFYGVQSLLQLVKRSREGTLELPSVRIEDWPSLKLRFLHWDTKHHQDRLETLKRFLDWAARFKINMIGYELEDKFAYPSHPVIGAPGAFTAEELQELVDYGLERFIQVVPNIQSPAHMAYVLKHEEFAHLRADGMNYQACLCDEETYDLIFSMYQDLIDATQGIDYFFVSTDELYYAGICGKCEEPYNPENRSLKWAEFANRAHDFLKERDRRMLAWVEYPLMVEHISKLPSDLIDGVLGSNQAFIEAERKRGIRQLIYTSLQGSEYLFPNYWSAASGDFRSQRGRLQSTYDALSQDLGNPIGVFGAAWGDSGLHNETFWLGWSTVAQYGWSKGNPPVEQHVVEFFDTFYGPEVTGMFDIYQGLQKQARFFQRSWDRVVSRARGKGYGNSRGKGIGVIRRDETLPQPALPNLPGLDFVPVYLERKSELIDQARVNADEVQIILHKLYSNLLRSERNQHNLEVLYSLAQFTQHHANLIMALESIESSLIEARDAAESDRARRAVGSMVSAYRTAQSTIEDRKETFGNLETIWGKGWFPKGQAVGGKQFVHVLDDVKDHWADRRSDLSYMIAPEESINLEGWSASLADVIREYARQEGIDPNTIVLDEEPEE